MNAGFRLWAQDHRCGIQDVETEYMMGNAEVGFRMRMWDEGFRIQDLGCGQDRGCGKSGLHADTEFRM